MFLKRVLYLKHSVLLIFDISFKVKKKKNIAYPNNFNRKIIQR